MTIHRASLRSCALLACACLALSMLVACDDIFPQPPSSRSSSSSPDGVDDDGDDAPAAKPAKKTKPRKTTPGKPTGPATPSFVVKGQVELGVGVFPDGTATDDLADYKFNVPALAPSKHHVAYRLSDDEAAAITRFYKDYAKSVGYRRLNSTSFAWTPPESCPPDMSCVYQKLVHRTRPAVVAMSERFRARAKQQDYDATETAQLMLAFVQAIPYELPDDPFGLKPPPAVMAERSGDCDSKALLLHIMLESAGIDSVVISSKSHAHSMLGIAVTAPGKTFEFRGRRYAFAETTAIGSPIGHINPPLLSPSDWKVEFGGRK